MLRALAVSLVCLVASTAAAQSNGASPELNRASRALSAVWRPISAAPTAETVQTACAGAVEEMSAVEAALPPVLTPESLARVRSLHGLLIVPTGDNPAEAYFFPPVELAWFTSGLGAISVLNEGEGFLSLRDASGQTIAIQLGRSAGQPILRLRAPEGAILNFVGCAPVGR